MFETLTTAPPDAILGLNEAFKKDPNPEKINLSVGVYKDAAGNTPVMNCVRQAEERILHDETTKNYLSIEGSAEYGRLVRELLLGPDHEVVENNRAITAHTPGGTGALRVAGDFIKRMFPAASVWLSAPTWPNHPAVFDAAGVPVKTYPYFDKETNGLNFEAMLAAIKDIPAGDVLLLHGCCHNPTGIDPTPEQWAEIAEVVGGRGLLPLIDFAYHGLADGFREDAAGLAALARPGRELLVAGSYSKNFGLYNERVGALTVVAATQDAAAAALSHVKARIRSNYSNPPAHGSAIVTTVLGDSELRATWDAEVKGMRDRINGMRTLFVETLAAKGAEGDFSFITRQRGMFSFSGLTPDQVTELREKYSIYIVGSGRINVAGMTEANIDRLCEAIAAVL